MDLIPFGWDPFFGTGPGFPSLPQFSSGFPKVDVKETNDQCIVIADIPGIDPKKVNIEVGRNALKLSGTVEEEKESKGKNFYRKERSMHSFERVIPLPCEVKESETKAVSKNGILTITLPKLHAEALKGRKIPIEEA